VEVYDPEVNSWETLAPMPSPRAYFSACVVNGKIYAIGGIHKFPFPGLTTIFEYDPASDTWEVKQPMLKGRYLPSTCVVDGKIFCIGGNPLDLAADGSTAVEVYDPATDSVYQASDMNYLRYGAASGVVNDKIYIMGGCNDAHYNTYTSKTEIGIPIFD
jgi:N-acetylneuraminic acid mutarotase